jgi:glycosyltransferase involved in cell wall biosynthesis
MPPAKTPSTHRGSAPLKVLTLVDGIGTYGGGESLAREITQRLDPARYEPTYCVTRWEPRPENRPALDELDAAGVEFLGLKRAARADPRPWGPILQRLRRGQVDILHSHKFGSNVWAAFLSRLSRPPVFVAHEHTWSYTGNRTRAFLDRSLIAASADAFVAVSRDDQRKMVEIEGVPAEKIRFIPNGIELEPAPEGARAEVRAQLGLGPSQPVVGTVATLRSQKALDVLIESALILRREFPDLVLLIVGGGAATEPGEGSRLRELAAKRGMSEHVQFLGLRDDIPSVLAAFDVAAISSDYEGSPLSVMEYMEAARPVVATRVGGVPDIVVDGETGILVPPRDPQALAGGISRLLSDPDLARRMGEAGRRRRRTEFELSETVRRIEQLYDELYADWTGDRG